MSKNNFYYAGDRDKEKALKEKIKCIGEPEFLGSGSGSSRSKNRTLVYHIRQNSGAGIVEDKAIKIIPCNSCQIPEGADNNKIRTLFEKLTNEAVSSDNSIKKEINNWTLASTCPHVLPLDDGYMTLKWKKESEIGVDYILSMPLSECLSKRIKKYESGNSSLTESEECIIQLGIDLCKALEELEALPQTICHRDIKPDNIYWVEEKGYYCLGDFGISVAENENQHTGSGTLSYCAPEQIVHFSQSERDHRQDIYSLGLVLYELADTKPISDHYDERIHKEYLPPLNNISPGLDQIIHKACMYYAKDRFQHASEFRDCLEKLQADRSFILEESDDGINATRLPDNTGSPYDPADVDGNACAGTSNRDLWNAGHFWYESSKQDGNRFHEFEIHKKIMPNGRPMRGRDFSAHVVLEDGQKEYLLSDVISKIDNHMYLIGDGGIGKTTALYSIMKDAYDKKEYIESDVKTIPLFIELSKAPDIYGKVYEKGHSTFIRRYISLLVNSLKSGKAFLSRHEDGIGDVFDREYDDVVESINHILQSSSSVTYLLLLDGFNEVSRTVLPETNCSVVEMVADEIYVLQNAHNYPNVKIVLTGRADEAFISDEFSRYYLTGVKDEEIIDYLESYNINKESIVGNSRLIKTLEIPLFLKLYCLLKNQDNISAPGEILYKFFNEHMEELGIYTAQYRISEIDADLKASGALNSLNRIDKYMQCFILDFLLPEIAWYMEQNEIFFLSTPEIKNIITPVLSGRSDTDVCGQYGEMLFVKYHNGSDIGSCTSKYADLLSELGNAVNAIIECCVYSLGILYNSNHCFGFIHQHFRDYFAAVRNVNHLRLAIFASEKDVETGFSCLDSFNRYLLGENVALFIGEILGEHKNIPYYEENRWKENIPNSICDRNLIFRCLGLYRNKFHDDEGVGYGIRNLLKIIVATRGTLAAMDLSYLDLRKCSLNNICLQDSNLTGCLIFHGNIFPNGHIKSIEKAEFSPSGEYIISADDGGSIKMWHLRTLKYEKTIMEYSWSVTTIQFSNDGLFFLAGTPKKVDIFDARDFRLIHSFKGAFNAVFSYNSRYIALAYLQKKIRIVDIKTFKCKGKLGRISFPFWEFYGDILRFSPDNEYFAFVNQEQKVEIWNVPKCKFVGTLPNSMISRCIDFDSKGKKIVCGKEEGVLCVYNLNSRIAPDDIPEVEIKVSSGTITSVKFVQKDTAIAIGYSSGQLILLDLRKVNEEDNYKQYKLLDNVQSRINSIVEYDDGKSNYIVCASAYSGIRIWDIKRKRAGVIERGDSDQITDISYSPDNKYVAVAGGNLEALVFDIKAKKCIGCFENKKFPINAISYSPDGRTLAAASIDGTVTIFDCVNYTPIKSYKPHEEYIKSIQYSKSFIVTVSYDNTAGIYNSSEGSLLKYSGEGIAILGPDEKTIMVGDFGGISEYEIKTGTKIKQYWGFINPYRSYMSLSKFQNQYNRIRSVAMSPDEKKLLFGSDYGTLEIWEINSNRCMAILRNTTGTSVGSVKFVTFSPDGRFVAGVNPYSNSNIKIYDAESYRCCSILNLMRKNQKGKKITNLSSGVTCIKFNNDSSQIITGAYDDGYMQVWELQEKRNRGKNYPFSADSFIFKIYDELFRNFNPDNFEFDYNYNCSAKIKFVHGLKLQRTNIRNLNASSTLTKEDLEILSFYGAITE